MTIIAKILPESTHCGFIVDVCNAGKEPIELIVPNPYTDVSFADSSGVSIAKNTLFAWQQSNPHIILQPDQFVLAMLTVCPLCISVCGVVKLKVCLNWFFTESGKHQVDWVEGNIEFVSPANSKPIIRKRDISFSEAVLSANPGLLNVSDYITILDYSDKSHPPWRGVTVPMWG